MATSITIIRKLENLKSMPHKLNYDRAFLTKKEEYLLDSLERLAENQKIIAQSLADIYKKLYL